MNESNAKPRTAAGARRPQLTYYHANAKGSGSAVKFDLVPASATADGCMYLTIANQLTVGNRNAETPTFSTFDWEKSIVVKLGFGDLCKLLQVFRGECESLDDGKGLYHRSVKSAFSTNIRLRHLVEPVCGYHLEVYRTGSVETSAKFCLAPAEALGLCEVITSSLLMVAFGVPAARAEFAAVEVERAGDAA